MGESVKRFEKVNIDALVPYARNARTHSKEQITQLRASLREFGFVNPVIVDKDYNIIAGHGRIMAAKEENIAEVPCVFVEHLTDAQKKAYILADNRLAMNAGWDNEMLSVELQDLQELGADLSLLGFDDKELDKLLNDDETTEDDFDVEGALNEPTISQHGDLWLLGNHRLIVGDATHLETYEKLMDGKCANLCITDPPYNVDYQGTAGKIKNDNMSNDKFYQFLLDSFVGIETALSGDGAAYIFHADSEGLNFRLAFRDGGFKLSQTLIWEKNVAPPTRQDYFWLHEPILYGWKQKGKHEWYGDRKQKTVLHCNKPIKSELHPTMKPIELLETLIKNSSMSNCIVLDPFGGSGSTLIACEQLNRQCYTCELDEKYADVIVKRYIDLKDADDGVFLVRDNQQIPYAEVVA